MIRFILNPAAKSWHAGSCMKAISQALEQAGISHEVRETTHPGHIAQLAGELSQLDTDMLGVVGGDGTLNELAAGPVESYPPVFYVPYGSGNDFARGIGLPINAKNAPSLAVDHSNLSPRAVDIGLAQVPGRADRRFMVSGGIGFDAAVCADMLKGKLKKRLNRLKLGFLTYFFYGIKNMLFCPLVGGTLTLDGGKKVLEFKNMAFLSAHNLPYEGGGFYFAPKALPGDGQLDLCLITARNHFRFILCLAASVFKGRHIKMKGVHYLRCQKAELQLDQALWMHTDGELGEKTDRIVFQTADIKISIMQ